MNIRKILIPALLLLAIAVIVVWASLSDNNKGNDVITIDSSPGVEGEPIDITLDFFEAWVSARNSTTSDPYSEKLVPSDSLNDDLDQRILAAEADFRNNEKDPVLCQYAVPEKLRVKSIFENETDAQILVSPKENASGTQSVVTLTKRAENFWLITDIKCGSGEQAPDVGEFSFDTEGFLLKDSLPASLDSQYWHIIFEQDKVMGHTAPLFFSDSSICIQDGEEKTCSDGFLFETMKARIQGSMTEAGVDVKRVELLN